MISLIMGDYAILWRLDDGGCGSRIGMAEIRVD